MAAAIFFVSGGPLCGGLSFFVPPGGVCACVGVLRACGGCLGVYTKSQGIFVVQCLNHTMH